MASKQKSVGAGGTLRLANRILQQGAKSLNPEAEKGRELIKNSMAVLKDPYCQVLLANNVADYFQGHSQDFRMAAESFPCVAPPFEKFFIEWSFRNDETLSKHQFGTTVKAYPAAEHRDRWRALPATETTAKVLAFHEAHADALKWAINLDLWMWHPDSPMPFHTDEIACAFVDGLGGLIELAVFDGHDGKPSGGEMFCVPLLAMCFMGLKRTIFHDAPPEDRPSPKWLRRMRQPELRYKVLQVSPIRKLLHSEGNIDHNGLAQALHICKGHFKHYTQEKPLFGKHSGNLWFQPHVRGNREHGEIKKTYNVKPPIEPPNDPKTDA